MPEPWRDKEEIKWLKHESLNSKTEAKNIDNSTKMPFEINTNERNSNFPSITNLRANFGKQKETQSLKSTEYHPYLKI